LKFTLALDSRIDAVVMFDPVRELTSFGTGPDFARSFGLDRALTLTCSSK
jgi:hypothetical protein